MNNLIKEEETKIEEKIMIGKFYFTLILAILFTFIPIYILYNIYNSVLETSKIWTKQDSNAFSMLLEENPRFIAMALSLSFLFVFASGFFFSRYWRKTFEMFRKFKKIQKERKI